MKKRIIEQYMWILCFYIISALPLYAQTEIKKTILGDAGPYQSVLLGTNTGLYRLTENSSLTLLWSGGQIKKILASPQGYYLLTDRGIVFSKDLTNWEERNQGLPVKVLKEIDQGKKQFVRQVQDLKDLEYNPADPAMLVTATRDRVFLSRDGGLTWKNLGMPPANTNGLKAVAVANLNEPVVLPPTEFMGSMRCLSIRGDWIRTNMDISEQGS